jgi:hypothetical protein
MSKRGADALQGLDAVISSNGVQYGSTSKLEDEMQIQMLGSGEDQDSTVRLDCRD